MKKKSLTLLLPSLLSGCTAFNATPVPDTTPPALVFVDGQIRESAAIIAHTQKRLLPPPVKWGHTIRTVLLWKPLRCVHWILL